MTWLQGMSILAEMIAAVVRMIESGLSHDEALRRVRAIESDAAQVDTDVDAIVRASRAAAKASATMAPGAALIPSGPDPAA